MVSLGHNQSINFFYFHNIVFLVSLHHSTPRQHAFPLSHYIHISTPASSSTCLFSTTNKHNLNLLSPITKSLLTHTKASFWRKQSCLFDVQLHDIADGTFSGCRCWKCACFRRGIWFNPGWIYPRFEVGTQPLPPTVALWNHNIISNIWSGRFRGLKIL